MKRYILLLIILILSSLSKAQDLQKDEILFNKGIASYSFVYDDIDVDFEIEMLDSLIVEEKIKMEILKELKEQALGRSSEYFEEVVDDFPDSKLFFRSMNNVAYISLELGEIDSAIKYYKIILESKANDNELGGIGEGIMADPYALYKNRACKSLANIYLEKGDHVMALKYIELTKKYPYSHFGGNEVVADKIYISKLYSQCYIGLGDVDKALSYSLPEAFYRGLASNDDILDVLITILKQNYTKEQIDLELDKSLKNISIDEEDSNVSRITFMKTEIRLPYHFFGKGSVKDFDYSDFDKLPSLDKSRYKFLNSEFYKF